MKRIILTSCFWLVLMSAFAQQSMQKKLQNQFIAVEDNGVIEIPEGNFTLDASLWLDSKKNITIKGAGMDKTILSFKGQTSGAEGIKITDAEHIIIQDLTVEDTKGDCIKVQNTKGIHFQRVKTQWTGKPNKNNGAYGLYPVQCTEVLIENSVARGASDAGIYVGQSDGIVVRNCKAVENVAGIEIENSTNADVYDNEAYQNTGGVLVFDLPDLIKKKGGNVRVFNNYIHDNNYKNFAPKGNIVGKVPPGTGVLILSTNNVEIFNNRIEYNRSLGVGMISYYMTENPIKDKEYYPYITNIHIHHNQFKRKNRPTTGQGRFGLMFRFKIKFGRHVPHILWDGILDENIGTEADHKICIHDNSPETFGNLDAANGFKNVHNELFDHNCKLDALPKIELKK